MLYRQILSEQLRELGIDIIDEFRREGHKLPFKETSRLLGTWWKNEPEQVKKTFKNLSHLAEEEHRRMFPAYKYQPEARVAVTNRKKKPTAKRFQDRSQSPDETVEASDFEMNTPDPESPVHLELPLDQQTIDALSNNTLSWYYTVPHPSFLPYPGVLIKHEPVPAVVSFDIEYPASPVRSENESPKLLSPSEQMAEEGSPLEDTFAFVPWE
ncbi:hypothetical protein HDU93_003195 [Gonapodya sp. JEL0774]|nr:hypothetical protein HDU93_003195 [Gonapodya sp. JEL0774]